MHTFAVNRKIDYSIPVVFKLLAEPKKPAATVVQKTVATKPAATKITAQPQQEQKKSTTITPSSTKPTVKKIEKKESFDTPLRGTQDERKEDKPKAVQTEENTEKKDIPKIPVQAPAVPQPAQAQVSDNYREVEALRRTAQLQKELVQQWHPPVGVPADCTCDVSFFVNKKGIIEQVKIAKSSGIMMFDISARQALFSMKMPQWTYGKSLTISFK